MKLFKKVIFISAMLISTSAFAPGPSQSVIAPYSNANNTPDLINISDDFSDSLIADEESADDTESKFDSPEPTPESKKVRFTVPESAFQTETFATPETHEDEYFPLYVPRVMQAEKGSTWYVIASPVPEPETYRLLLLGVGVICFVARRKMLR